MLKVVGSTFRIVCAGACIGLGMMTTGPVRAAQIVSVAPQFTSEAVLDIPKQLKSHRSSAHLAALGQPAAGKSDPASYQLDSGVASWYRERGATAPLTDHPVYCHGYGCEFQTAVPIDDGGIAALRRIFAGHTANAMEERRAISEAVRWWERQASPLLGGPPREHGSDIAHAHHPGATDCIDEATNSTTILVFLERRGFLKFHHVERPASRGIIVNAHSTAIIRETGGDEWAVDMWMHNMGEAPDIMTETKWMSQA